MSTTKFKMKYELPQEDLWYDTEDSEQSVLSLMFKDSEDVQNDFIENYNSKLAKAEPQVTSFEPEDDWGETEYKWKLTNKSYNRL